MGAITKAKLAERVHERVGLTKKESAEFVDDLFYVMRKALADGDKVKNLRASGTSW
jgi:integration host factor subunit alpha